MTVRHTVKELARQAGVAASFMPKPLGGVQGSGMHSHLSLWKDGANAFVDTDDRYGLSSIAHRFIAGLLAHASEITAVTNQWVNSYKRLVPGHEAPVNVSWARNNRSALVRIPTIKQGKTDSTRIEYRAPDPAANPYLCFSPSSWRRGWRASAATTSCRPRRPATSSTGRDHDREVLPTTLKEATDRMEGPSCWPRRSATTSSSGSCATSAPSGAPTPSR